MNNHLAIQIDCDSEMAIYNHYRILDQAENLCNNLTYYSALSRFKQILDKYQLKSTLFVIGKDLENDKKCLIISQFALSGHEIANHTYSHPSYFMSYNYDQRVREIKKANEIIYEKIGVTPKGFRTPNFEADTLTIKILKELQFAYDSSMLSTYFSPVIKLVKNFTSPNMSSAVKSGYLGAWQNLFAPKEAYIPQETKIWKRFKGDKLDNIIELPVSTFPYLHFPCHSSYLLSLPTKIRFKMVDYLINWHVKHNKTLIYVFHLTDLVENRYLFGTEAMLYKSLDERLNFIDQFCKMAAESFNSLTTQEYTNTLKRRM